MHAKRKYYTAFSLLIVSFWGYFIVQILTNSHWQMDLETGQTVITQTLLLAIVGGIYLIFRNISKRNQLRFSFLYNLFGTLNLVIGSLGVILLRGDSEPSKPVFTASLALGVIIYRNIYFSKKV